MEVQMIREGLWRWTAPHPDWAPGKDWPEQVGCVYYEAPEAVVLVDPLVPSKPAEEARFWQALDRDVERLGRSVVVVLTVRWHERSVEQVAARYRGTVWRRERPNELPAGVEAHDISPVEETIFWIPEHAALVPGDVLVNETGRLQVCPDSWLPEGASRASVRAALRPLLELPVELVLVSHGDPILEGGSEALARALGHAPSAA
jgi:glyoxylase-like metal-dependent hydrolase (beta-lactamase superfamily II)